METPPKKHWGVDRARVLLCSTAKCFADDVPRSVEILSDILQNSTLATEQVGGSLRYVDETNSPTHAHLAHLIFQPPSPHPHPS